MPSPSTSTPAATSDYRSPKSQCDLVMKGGVTSGVVYPPALCRLATEYRFRDIGGTSAGAIAAAAAAAAEYGRESGGFSKLMALSRWIGEDQHLLNLFQPSRQTKPLLDLLIEGVKQGGAIPAQPLRAIPLVRRMIPHPVWPNQVRDFGIGVAIGLVLSLLLTLALVIAFAVYESATDREISWDRLLWPAFAALAIVLGVLFGIVGWLAGGLVGRFLRLYEIVVKEIPRNYLGLCRGRAEAPGGPAVLTDWLSESLNDLAGLPKNGPPLTFGDLATKSNVDGQEASINLRMVTTNLSQGRPYVLPIDVNQFVFNEDEMRDFFPDNVVDHMMATAPEWPPAPTGYHLLPPTEQLPVVVAARLSLSFPVLISAVPFYTVKATSTERYEAERATNPDFKFHPDDDFQKNWFSDGGISSNFPIHFFDAWLPTRPTFGISLTSLPKKALEEPEKHLADYVGSAEVPLNGTSPAAGSKTPPSASDAIRKDIYLPKATDDLTPDCKPVDNLSGLVGAMWRSAQTYRDTTQTGLPSYRDRVVQIRLANSEGGLNLAMNPTTIEGMTKKGIKAAEVLIEEFDFANHRWVRFRVLMAQLEAQLRELVQDFDDVTDGRLSYGELIDEVPWKHSYAYRHQEPEPWCREAVKRIDELRVLLERWKSQHQTWRTKNPRWTADTFFEPESPRPEPILRVTPDL